MALRRGWLELTIGLAALALILGGGAGIAFHRQAQQYAGLNIAPADLDFGNAWEQRAFPLTVTLHNGSNRPIAVADLQTSCSCTAVEPRECVVPAGGSMPLHLTLDLTTAFDQRPAEQATFTVALQPVLADGPAGLPAWELHGLVARPIVFRPGTLEIETVRGQPPAFVAVRVEPRLPLAGVSITAPAAVATATLGPPDAAGVHTLSVTPAAQASVGVTHGEIRFAWPASAASGTAPPSALLPVKITTVGPVRSLPAEVRFGAVRQDQPCEQTLLLTTPADLPEFRIAALRSGPGVAATAVDGQHLARRHEVGVVLQADGSGGHDSTVEIDTLDSAGISDTLRVPVSAYVLKINTTAVPAPPGPVEAPRPATSHAAASAGATP